MTGSLRKACGPLDLWQKSHCLWEDTHSASDNYSKTKLLVFSRFPQLLFWYKCQNSKMMIHVQKRMKDKKPLKSHYLKIKGWLNHWHQAGNSIMKSSKSFQIYFQGCQSFKTSIISLNKLRLPNMQTVRIRPCKSTPTVSASFLTSKWTIRWLVPKIYPGQQFTLDGQLLSLSTLMKLTNWHFL